MPVVGAHGTTQDSIVYDQTEHGPAPVSSKAIVYEDRNAHVRSSITIPKDDVRT